MVDHQHPDIQGGRTGAAPENTPDGSPTQQRQPVNQHPYPGGNGERAKQKSAAIRRTIHFAIYYWRRHREKAKITDWIIIVLTFAIVYLAYETGKQTDELITAANIQAGAATQSAAAARSFADSAKGIEIQSNLTTSKFDTMAKNSGQALKDNRSGIQDTLRANVEANRPWIGISQLQVRNFEDGKEATLEFDIENDGHSAAYITLAQMNGKIFYSFPDKPIFNVSNPFNATSNALLAPGQKGLALTFSETVNVSKLARKTMVGETYYAFAEVDYVDLRTKVSHFTHACWLYDPPQKQWHTCHTYNDAD